MKSNPAFRLAFRYFLILVGFFAYSKWNSQGINATQTLFCLGISAFISFIGLLILYLKKKSDPQVDTFRLLILITVQLLSYLSVCLALIYTNQPDTLALHLLALALSNIVAQTVFLVKSIKSHE